jgi:hypothetical protein
MQGVTQIECSKPSIQPEFYLNVRIFDTQTAFIMTKGIPDMDMPFS